MREISYCQALLEAQDQLLQNDPDVFLMGEGVDDPKAIFESTKGLYEKYGVERVFDMPLAENGMTGVAIGAALNGMRPIMTHQRIDFTLYAMDQLVNHAAKRCYASGGRQSVPLTVRAVVGRGWGQGPQHSQSLQSMMAHVPGLKVVMPATPHDAKGLLMGSVYDDNPVIYIEHRRLYDEVGPVSEESYKESLGECVVRRPGTDATIVAFSYMQLEAAKAGAILEKLDIDVEVIDPRCLKPLDLQAINESVFKTGRLVVADLGWRFCGITAEIAASVTEEVFDMIKCPIKRIALPDVPTPTTPALEGAYYPDYRDIVQAIYEMVTGDPSPFKPEWELDEDEAGSKAGSKEYSGPF